MSKLFYLTPLIVPAALSHLSDLPCQILTLAKHSDVFQAGKTIAGKTIEKALGKMIQWQNNFKSFCH
ncbi:MAG: hypothetical protein ACREOO_27505 [bacterium]